MPDDPFNGLRLSEQAPAAKLDQRLFEAQPAPKPTQTKPVEVDPARAPDTPKKLASETSSPKPALLSAPPSAGPRFDLEDEARYKASYYFSNEELLALDDLKLELHRDLDKKVTKNDLMRSALHMLLEDHQVSPDRSYATRKIKKRRSPA